MPAYMQKVGQYWIFAVHGLPEQLAPCGCGIFDSHAPPLRSDGKHECNMFRTVRTLQGRLLENALARGLKRKGEY